MQRMEGDTQLDSEVFFTAPMIIDIDCAKVLREKILSFISESQKISSSAPSEDLFCMNIDLFKTKKEA